MFGLEKKIEKVAARNETEAKRTYLPAVDVAENEAGYTIYADVPGATKDSVNVTYENGVVTLTAEAETKEEGKKGSLIFREFRRASYERAFRIGDDVDADAISAEIANGVLQVKLPRKASAKKTISVK